MDVSRATAKACCGRSLECSAPPSALLEVLRKSLPDGKEERISKDAGTLRDALRKDDVALRKAWMEPLHVAYLTYEAVRSAQGDGCLYAEFHVTHGDAVSRRGTAELRSRLALALAAAQHACTGAPTVQHARMILHVASCRGNKDLIRLCDVAISLSDPGQSGRACVVGVVFAIVTSRGDTCVQIGKNTRLRISGSKFGHVLRRLRAADLWIGLDIDLRHVEPRSIEVALHMTHARKIFLHPESVEAFANLKDDRRGNQLKSNLVADDVLVQLGFDPAPFLREAELVDDKPTSDSSGDYSDLSAGSRDHLLRDWKEDILEAATVAKRKMIEATQQLGGRAAGMRGASPGDFDVEANVFDEDAMRRSLEHHPAVRLLQDPVPGLARCIVIDVEDPSWLGCSLSDVFGVLVNRARVPVAALKVMMLKVVERASTTFAQKQQMLAYMTTQYLGSALPHSPWAAEFAISARKALHHLNAHRHRQMSLDAFLVHHFPSIQQAYPNVWRAKSDILETSWRKEPTSIHASSFRSDEERKIPFQQITDGIKTVFLGLFQNMWSICSEVVEPGSLKANIYYAFLSLLILACTIVDPLLFGYICGMPQPGCNNGWFSVKVVLESMYVMCMLYTFNVGYLRKEEDGKTTVATNREDIALHYLSGWFWADLVSVTVYFICIPIYNDSSECRNWQTDSTSSSTFPLTGYTSMCSSTGPCCQAASWVEFIPLLSLLRLLRLIWMEIPMFMKQTYMYVLCIMLFAFFLEAHVVGAIWIFISRQLDWVYSCVVTDGIFEDDGQVFTQGETIPKWLVNPLSNECPTNTTSVCGDSGILNPWLQFQDRGKIYLAGTYFGFHTVANFGPEDIPCTTGEIMLSLASVIIGLASFALIIGEIDSIVREKNKINVWFREKLDDTHKFIERHKLPPELSQRILQYIEEGWRRNRGIEDKALLSSLSATLRRDVQLCMHRRMVADVPFFRQCSPEFVDAVCEKLEAGWCPPNEILIHKGSIGVEMYFLQEGEVEVGSDSHMTHVFARMRAGSFFGELALLQEEGLLRTASVRSTTYCEYATLKKEDLDELLLRFPREKKMLWHMSQQRKANSDRLEAQEAAEAHAAIICQRAVRRYRIKKLLQSHKTDRPSSSNANSRPSNQ